MILLGILNDGLTLGGWLATRGVWETLPSALVLLIAKDILLLTTFSILCYNLGDNEEGTWKLYLGTLVQYSQHVGTLLVESIPSSSNTFPDALQATEIATLRASEVSDVL